jgi:hypothetical protein
MASVFNGTKGLQITVQTGLDLTGNTNAAIKYVAPDGTTGSWTPTISTPTGGNMVYTTDYDDLTLAGDYYIQAYSEFATGITGATYQYAYYGDICKLRVMQRKVS